MSSIRVPCCNCITLTTKIIKVIGNKQQTSKQTNRQTEINKQNSWRVLLLLLLLCWLAAAWDVRKCLCHDLKCVASG